MHAGELVAMSEGIGKGSHFLALPPHTGRVGDECLRHH